MVICNASLGPIDVIEVCEHDGRVKISWEPYDGMFFEKYQLRLHGANPRNIDIFEKNSTCYIDSIFANGAIWGDVVIYAHGDENHYGDSASLTDYQPKNLICTTNEFNQPILNWDECIYYANSAGYKIHRVYTELHTINSNDITAWIDEDHPLVFGEIRSYYVKAVNSDNQVYEYFDDQYLSKAYLGSIFTKYYSDIIFSNNGNTYVVNDSIRIFDANTMELLNARYHQTNSSLGIRYVESSNELFWANANYVREIDPTTLFNIENTHIDDLLPGVENPNMYEFQVTENRFFIVASSQGTLSCYVINRNNGSYFNVLEIGLTFNYGLHKMAIIVLIVTTYIILKMKMYPLCAIWMLTMCIFFEIMKSLQLFQEQMYLLDDSMIFKQ